MDPALLAFTADFLNVPVERLSPHSRLFGDLGVDGQDAVDFLEAFGERFNVDIGVLELRRHFGPEGLPPWFLFSWVRQILRRLCGCKAEKAAGLAPLTLSDLDKLIRKTENKV